MNFEEFKKTFNPNTPRFCTECNYQLGKENISQYNSGLYECPNCNEFVSIMYAHYKPASQVLSKEAVKQNKMMEEVVSYCSRCYKIGHYEMHKLETYFECKACKFTQFKSDKRKFVPSALDPLPFLLADEGNKMIIVCKYCNFEPSLQRDMYGELYGSCNCGSTEFVSIKKIDKKPTIKGVLKTVNKCPHCKSVDSFRDVPETRKEKAKRECIICGESWYGNEIYHETFVEKVFSLV